MPIEVQAYNEQWPVQFQKIKHNLQKHIKGSYLSIEHVGSTSVPGLYAKPKIDIDIIVKNNLEKPAIILDLNSIGYDHIGDMGITGREAFRYARSADHNLYLIEEINIAWLNHRYLRDYLREHENVRTTYSELKLSLAQKFPDDIDAYIDGKTAFIIDILRKSDMDEHSLAEIEEQNNL